MSVIDDRTFQISNSLHSLNTHLYADAVHIDVYFLYICMNAFDCEQRQIACSILSLVGVLSSLHHRFGVVRGGCIASCCESALLSCHLRVRALFIK